MAECPEVPELELRIALLPPLSRGMPVAPAPWAASAPTLHAVRLVALWQAEGPVPLREAFRLLVDAVEVGGAILRTIAASEHGYPDPRHWRFPDLEALLPELRAIVWDKILAGHLVVEANGRTLTPTELATPTPDWSTSRLLRPKRPFVKVTVRPLPTVSVVRNSRKPAPAVVRAAAERIAERHAERHPDEPLVFDDFWQRLKAEIPGFTITQLIARQALNYAPQLRGKPGYRRKSKPDANR